MMIICLGTRKNNLFFYVPAMFFVLGGSRNSTSFGKKLEKRLGGKKLLANQIH